MRGEISMNIIPIVAHQIEDWLDVGVNPIIVILSIPAVFVLAIPIAKFIVSRYTYRCTECGEVFKPKFWRAHAGIHGPNGRYQYCPKCKKITWCKYE